LPLPTRPPYTAFVGNLAFETIEDDLQGFFEGLEVGLV
jgi:translation initiation factor 4B